MSTESMKEFIRDAVLSDTELTDNMYNNSEMRIDFEDRLDPEYAGRLIFGDLAEAEREHELEAQFNELEMKESLDIDALADSFLKGGVD